MYSSLSRTAQFLSGTVIHGDPFLGDQTIIGISAVAHPPTGASRIVGESSVRQHWDVFHDDLNVSQELVYILERRRHRDLVFDFHATYSLELFAVMQYAAAQESEACQDLCLHSQSISLPIPQYRQEDVDEKCVGSQTGSVLKRQRECICALFINRYGRDFRTLVCPSLMYFMLQLELKHFLRIGCENPTSQNRNHPHPGNGPGTFLVAAATSNVKPRRAPRMEVIVPVYPEINAIASLDTEIGFGKIVPVIESDFTEDSGIGLISPPRVIPNGGRCRSMCIGCRLCAHRRHDSQVEVIDDFGE
jgi:hypothetical protein